MPYIYVILCPAFVGFSTLAPVFAVDKKVGRRTTFARSRLFSRTCYNKSQGLSSFSRLIIVYVRFQDANRPENVCIRIQKGK